MDFKKELADALQLQQRLISELAKTQGVIGFLIHQIEKGNIPSPESTGG